MTWEKSGSFLDQSSEDSRSKGKDLSSGSKLTLSLSSILRHTEETDTPKAQDPHTKELCFQRCRFSSLNCFHAFNRYWMIQKEVVPGMGAAP